MSEIRMPAIKIKGLDELKDLVERFERAADELKKLAPLFAMLTVAESTRVDEPSEKQKRRMAARSG
jgi:hypothetical protein